MRATECGKEAWSEARADEQNRMEALPTKAIGPITAKLS